ncbi:MAG: AAA family ATPase [Bacillota bacterium]|nr:AAA family ATPase [Bacillota bacterium]
MNLYTNDPSRLPPGTVAVAPGEAEKAVWFGTLDNLATLREFQELAGGKVYAVLDGPVPITTMRTLAARGVVVVPRQGLATVLGLRSVPPVQETTVIPPAPSVTPVEETIPLPEVPRPPTRQAKPKGGPKGGRVIASYSSAGGVGKTFLAVNAAARLAQCGRRVVLVDLDWDYGDVWTVTHMTLKGPPQVTVANWFEVAADPVEYLAVHPRLVNLYVLPSRTVYSGRPLEANHVRRLIEELCGRFDAVILDLGPDSSLPHIAAALSSADTVLLVSTQEEGRIDKLRMFVRQAMDVCGIEKARLKLVINRVAPGYARSPKDVAKQLEMTEFRTVPEDPRAVRRSERKKTFPVLTKTAAGKALVVCLDDFLGDLIPAASSNNRSFLSRLAFWRKEA